MSAYGGHDDEYEKVGRSGAQYVHEHDDAHDMHVEVKHGLVRLQHVLVVWCLSVKRWRSPGQWCWSWKEWRGDGVYLDDVVPHKSDDEDDDEDVKKMMKKWAKRVGVVKTKAVLSCKNQYTSLK